MTANQAKIARNHLCVQCPSLAPLIEGTDLILLPAKSDIPVAEAVTKVVIGQMLSRQAASTIYERVRGRAHELQKEGSWQLPESELSSLGLSGRKVRTISEFARAYQNNQDDIECWESMGFEDLSLHVSSHWGLSSWSAAMLAIFYFAHEDVYPTGDGTLTRVRTLLTEAYDICFNETAAAPYRTYLSLYLWRLLDDGHL